MENPIVVLDNGGGTIKAGLAGDDEPSAVAPNCLARPKSSKKWLVADQIDKCDDIQSIPLRRPLDRGYLLNYEAEKEVWERVFKVLLKVRPQDSGLFLIEPPFALPHIKKITDELVFEEFGFRSLFVSSAAPLVHLYEARRRPESRLALGDCSLVVDSGFSFTHAVPVVQGFPVLHAVKRINLGGKALTNYLKELVSYSAWNVMDETYIMEDVKHKLCFCSMDVRADLDVARRKGKANAILCQYVLPDGVKHKRGFVKDPKAAAAYLNTAKEQQQATHQDQQQQQQQEEDEPLEIDADEEPPSTNNNNNNNQKPAIAVVDDQELTLTNERFMVPEMLFQPADLGMEEAGLSECIVRSVSSCHPDLHPLLYSNIVLTGGSVQFPFFREKLENELRPLIPDEYNVNIQITDSPIKAAWYGGSMMASSPGFSGCSVTKAEYEEEGSQRCRRRFLL